MRARALRDLRRFILAKHMEEERHEVRLYVLENLAMIAEAVGASPLVVAETIAKLDDEALPRRLLQEIRRVEAEGRETREERRAEAAQASADVLGAASFWRGDVVVVALLSLMASALTRRDHLLVFASDAFTVAIYMGPLFDLAKLERLDLTAFVDASGVHIRWSTGGLNLRPRTDPNAPRVVVNLGCPTSIAA